MKQTLIIILLLSFLSCSNQEKLNDELYLNYKAALQNESTFQFFLVLKFKNLNTKETREICTKGSFLHGAIHREYNLDYDETSREKAFQIAIKKNDRYFEFKNDSAIANMGVADYSMKDLYELEKKVNFDSIVKQIKKQKKWSMGLDDKEMLMYAHALFNRGILTGENNCMGGELIYIDRNKPQF